MPSARDVILKHIEAFNGRDSDGDPWAADAEFTAPGAQFSGRDNVIGFIAVFQEAFPDLRLEIEQLLTDGPAAAAEGIMAGTHDVSSAPPTAMSLRHDQMDLLGQLGLLPG